MANFHVLTVHYKNMFPPLHLLLKLYTINVIICVGIVLLNKDTNYMYAKSKSQTYLASETSRKQMAYSSADDAILIDTS